MKIAVLVTQYWNPMNRKKYKTGTCRDTVEELDTENRPAGFILVYEKRKIMRLDLTMNNISRALTTDYYE